MNFLSILVKLWPAIRDVFFGNMGLKDYLGKNKPVAMLCLALAVTLSSFLYLYEEAFLHGSASKVKAAKIVALKNQLNTVNKNCSN